MSAGHHIPGLPENHFHTESDWLLFCADHPKVMEWLQRPRRIDCNYQIPYLGGISTDGRVVFIDSRYHPIMRGTNYGLSLNTADTIPDHEVTEYVCVRFYGMRYEDKNLFRNPHIWGNTAERLAVLALDCEWDPYNKFIDSQLKAIEDGPVTRCPPTLATYPYRDDQVLLAKIKAAQQEN